jgi:hypothetical protein
VEWDLCGMKSERIYREVKVNMIGGGGRNYEGFD